MTHPQEEDPAVNQPDQMTDTEQKKKTEHIYSP